MKVELRPMSEVEFDAYLERMIPAYAAEGAKATGMAPDAALEFARRQISGLLPDGRATPGHEFRTVVTESGKAVGILWWAERTDRDPPDLFIYDIAIDEDRRGRGLGTAAMRALQEVAARRHVAAISLHVFATNDAAIRLYERLGYESTDRGDGGLHMTKHL